MNEFILSSEILTEFELESPKEYKVKAIVLLVENNRLNEGYSLNMLGKQMKDWVKDAISHFDCRFVSLAEKDLTGCIIETEYDEEGNMVKEFYIIIRYNLTICYSSLLPLVLSLKREILHFIRIESFNASLICCCLLFS